MCFNEFCGRLERNNYVSSLFSFSRTPPKIFYFKLLLNLNIFTMQISTFHLQIYHTQALVVPRGTLVLMNTGCLFCLTYFDRMLIKASFGIVCRHKSRILKEQQMQFNINKLAAVCSVCLGIQWKSHDSNEVLLFAPWTTSNSPKLTQNEVAAVIYRHRNSLLLSVLIFSFMIHGNVRKIAANFMRNCSADWLSCIRTKRAN